MISAKCSMGDALHILILAFRHTHKLNLDMPYVDQNTGYLARMVVISQSS